MDASALLADLHAAVPLIGPSLLACDFANLGREVDAVRQAGARVLHLDVMDGHFVPNLSIGVPVVAAVRRVTDLPLDVHLMISEPARYVEAFREAGADLITFHVETVADPVPLLREIRRLGALAGVAISPPTPVSSLEPCLGDCDLVLVMTVMPGFGGQQLRSEGLDKLHWLTERAGRGTLLSVDGGVNGETIAPCAAAGAQMFVVGTGLFGYPDYRERLAKLRETALSALGERV
jgi:ribulose-phosphate 3-epimerase